MTSAPTRVLRLNEWTTMEPDESGAGRVLRGLELTDSDRELLSELAASTSLEVTELRDGPAVSVGPHIGTVTLSCLRIVVLPKISIDNLMKLVAYAFGLSDMTVTTPRSRLSTAQSGPADLLGIGLLHAVERLARGGLLPKYQRKNEELSSPRGRIDMRALASRPPRMSLPCRYEDFTVDHALNQVIAAGLRLAARVMNDPDLRLDLARSADRFFGNLRRIALTGELLRELLANMDRRSSHYLDALRLVALIYQGSRVTDHTRAGDTVLSSFLLDMNLVFERFLERYLREVAPPGFDVISQDIRHDVFSFIDNESGWKHPYIKPDLVFRYRNKPVAVADAKYKDRLTNRPSTAELYQLITYGLSYDMPQPREVLLLHPLGARERDRDTTVLFAPRAANQQVRVRLVGVPIDEILSGGVARWWPLRASAHSSENRTSIRSRT